MSSFLKLDCSSVLNDVDPDYLTHLTVTTSDWHTVVRARLERDYPGLYLFAPDVRFDPANDPITAELRFISEADKDAFFLQHRDALAFVDPGAE